MAGSSLNLWRTTFSTAGLRRRCWTAARITRTFAVVLAPPQTDPSRRRHQLAHKLSSHRGIVGHDCYHLRWCSDASEYLPQEGAVNGVVSFLKIYEIQLERHSCLPPNFPQPANHKHHVRGRAIRSKHALLLRQQSLRLTVSTESPGNHFKKNLTRVCTAPRAIHWKAALGILEYINGITSENSITF